MVLLLVVDTEKKRFSLEKLAGTMLEFGLSPDEEESVSVSGTTAGLDNPRGGGNRLVVEVVVVNGSGPDLSAVRAEVGCVRPESRIPLTVSPSVAATIYLAGTDRLDPLGV
jgi:hypothetical protein